MKTWIHKSNLYIEAIARYREVASSPEWLIPKIEKFCAGVLPQSGAAPLPPPPPALALARPSFTRTHMHARKR